MTIFQKQGDHRFLVPTVTVNSQDLDEGFPAAACSFAYGDQGYHDCPPTFRLSGQVEPHNGDGRTFPRTIPSDNFLRTILHDSSPRFSVGHLPPEKSQTHVCIYMYAFIDTV